MQVIQNTANPDEFWSVSDGWTDRAGATEFSDDEVATLGLPEGSQCVPRSTGLTYKVIRFFQDPRCASQTIHAGLTLDEAKEHCADPEANSSTCTLPQNTARTAQFGGWFDGFTEEE